MSLPESEFIMKTCRTCKYYERGDCEYWSGEIEENDTCSHYELSKNVCEWESTGNIMDNAEFNVQCNHNPLIRGKVPNNFSFQDFRFCPFCGRKIVWK